MWDTSALGVQHSTAAVLQGHLDSVLALAFSPDGCLLATASAGACPRGGLGALGVELP